MPPPAFPILFGGGVPRWALGSDLATDYTIQRDYAPTRGMFPPGVDTHASTIYAPSSTGVYQPFAANIPVLTNLGLQTVPTATNKIRKSNDYADANWTKVDCTVTAAVEAGPISGTTSDLFTFGVAGTGDCRPPDIAVAAGPTVAYSRIFKRGNTDWVSIYLQSGSDFVRVWANLATGVIGSNTVSGAGVFTSKAIEALSNGYYRVTLVGNIPAATGYRIGGYPVTNDGSITRVNNSTLIVNNADLREGAFAVTPIINTSSVADATVNGNQQVISGLGTQLATGVAGMVQVDLRASQANSRFLAITDGSGANRLLVYQDTPTTVIILMTASSVGQGFVTAAISYGGVATIAFAFAQNYFTVRAVGQSATTPDTVGTYPAGLSQIGIGGDAYAAGANSYVQTRKLALDFLAPGDDPATKFAEWYARAQLAAAA